MSLRIVRQDGLRQIASRPPMVKQKAQAATPTNPPTTLPVVSIPATVDAASLTLGIGPILGAATGVLAVVLTVFGFGFSKLMDTRNDVAEMKGRLDSMDRSNAATANRTDQQLNAIMLRIDRLASDMHRVHEAIGMAEGDGGVAAVAPPSSPPRPTIVHPVVSTMRTARHGHTGLDVRMADGTIQRMMFVDGGALVPEP